jgi:hypothetical protein
MTSPDNKHGRTLADDVRTHVRPQAPFARAIDAAAGAQRCLD